jgi:hypothetical protein
VHCPWCVFDLPSPAIGGELQRLWTEGFRTLVVFVLAGLGLPAETVPLLVPPMFRSLDGLRQGRACRLDDLDSWLEFAATPPAHSRRPRVIPFLDVRGWDGESDLSPWLSSGFGGIKDILLLEEDEPQMKTQTLRHIRGFSREEYLERHRRTFALAERMELPLVYHADLTLHGEFVRDCLRDHPGVLVDIPHFGFSRRIMASFFRDHPRLFSDISGLEPHIRPAVSAYREFMTEFSSQVLLGSDSLAGWDFTPASRSLGLVRELRLPPAGEEAILSHNPRRFLGLD